MFKIKYILVMLHSTSEHHYDAGLVPSGTFCETRLHICKLIQL